MGMSVRLAGSLVACVLLASYPLGNASEYGRAVSQELRIVVCERRGQAFLEVRKATTLDGFMVGEQTEIVIPWSDLKPAGGGPPPSPPPALP